MRTKNHTKDFYFNPVVLRTAKTLWSFGCSECNRVKGIDNLKEKWGRCPEVNRDFIEK